MKKIILVILGVIVLSGGTYFFIPQNYPDIPITQRQDLATSTPVMSPQTTPIQPRSWKVVAISVAPGLEIEYPANLKIISNESAPIVHIEFEESSGDLARIFISIANIISVNKNLSDWLKSYDYFRNEYRSQTYGSYKRQDGVEVLASFGNTQSYDDAFIRIGTAVIYIKNGVNENTKARESEFREIIERIKLPSNNKVGVMANGGFSCIVRPDELMALYWETQYRKANPTTPFIYAPGSYCESPDGSKLMTMAYFTQGAGKGKEQIIVLFDKEGKITRVYKGNICHTVGDFDSPRILSVEQGKLNMFCLSGDAGYIAFNVYQSPLETLIPTEVERDTPIHNAIKSIVEKLYDIDFSQLNLF